MLLPKQGSLPRRVVVSRQFMSDRHTVSVMDDTDRGGPGVQCDQGVFEWRASTGGEPTSTSAFVGCPLMLNLDIRVLIYLFIGRFVQKQHAPLYFDVALC